MIETMAQSAEKLIRDYLPKCQVMQLATTHDTQPWICSVYYVVDDQLNVYWLSFPERRHSKDIVENADVAIAIAIKTDTPVIGLQAKGRAEICDDPEVVEQMAKQYVAKYSLGKKFYENFVNKTNKHYMYKFAPQVFVLFDEQHFPEDGRLEWQISASDQTDF